VYESGASGMATEKTVPEVESVRIDLLSSAESSSAQTAFTLLLDEGSPIALSLFSVIHQVSSCI